MSRRCPRPRATGRLPCVLRVRAFGCPHTLSGLCLRGPSNREAAAARRSYNAYIDQMVCATEGSAMKRPTSLERRAFIAAFVLMWIGIVAQVMGTPGKAVFVVTEVLILVATAWFSRRVGLG